MERLVYPFCAIIGQYMLKQGLLLNAINPRIGGVLVRGEKGTAKSTAVRALANLMPEICVVTDCPFSCDPKDRKHACDQCHSNTTPVSQIRRKVRMVELPLNATEDRVAGGIDFSKAVKEGKRTLSPGLLAAANRGILYVDEINLLDDHIVDIILDAAASGENILEREGISFRHPSKFILVGTMNPEEGELRPQLLDRFGLCVDVAGVPSLDQRVVLMARREAFDANPKAFCKMAEKQNSDIACKINKAQDLLPKIHISKELRGFICELCTKNNVAGHRADLVMEQAAMAMAAWHSHTRVTMDHIQQVSAMVLLHRRRETQPPMPESTPLSSDKSDSRQADDARADEKETRENQNREEMPMDASADPSDPAEDNKPEEIQEHSSIQQPMANEDTVFEMGPTFKIKPIETAKDRISRRGSGRRSRTRVSQKQGRYVKSRMDLQHNDIALDATLRAAAPYQKRRNTVNGLCITLTRSDLRGKLREKRMGNFLVFSVDASGSMGAKGRMAASKGAVMSLLLDAYQKRDKVAMVSFRRDGAAVNLPPTTSIDMAGKLLAEMPVGGRTPLSAGLVKTFEQVRNVLIKDPNARPIVILITDGKANVALDRGKPVEEALHLANAMSRDNRTCFIVVDTEDVGGVRFGLARQLAASLNARYFQINDLKAQALVDIVKGQHR